MARMPNVIGMEEKQAVETLERAGFACETAVSQPPRGYREGGRRVVVRQKRKQEKVCELIICEFKKRI